MNDDEFQKVLLKPHIDVLDTNTQRIRRNLVVTSMVTLIYFSSNGIDVAKSSFAGIKFNAVSEHYLYGLLLMSILYFLLHFVFSIIDALMENKLRLTGTVIPMVRSGMNFGDSTFAPNTDIEKYSTIFSWWFNKWVQVVDLTAKLPPDDYLIPESLADNKNIQQKIDTLNSNLSTIKQDAELIRKYASYIEICLKRFEQGFWHYQRRQLLRWMMFDVGIPILVGMGAIGMILYHWWLV